MEKIKSVKKNYLYNMIYKMFLIIVPILVTPYISRVLGASGSGQYSYTYSITTYFTLFASLGFDNYAQRLIASHQNDKKNQSIDFWEIFIVRLIPVFSTLIVYYLLIIFNVFGMKYTKLMWILSINIISVMFNIVYFFQGNEEFGIIIFRNIFIKFLSIVAIFTLVKGEKAIIIYTFIEALSILFSNLSLWGYLPKYLTKIRFVDLHPLRHIGPTFVLFLPTIATSVYTALDKTMIGIITHSDLENGNYEYAEKLVKMSMTIITSLSTVMIARNSRNFALKKYDLIKKNIYMSCKFVLFLGIPICFGLIAVADNMIPWYLGNDYEKAASLVKVLSPLVIIIGFSNVFGFQFLIPCHMDYRYTLSVLFGAFTNFIINIFLIKIAGAHGAAISTIISEFVVTFSMYIFVKKYIDIKEMLVPAFKYLFSGATMFFVLKHISLFLIPSVMNTVGIVLCGMIIYTTVLYILRDEFIKQVESYFKSIFRRKV